MSLAASSIPPNLERIRNQIADVCARCHRPSSAVALMAVSKMHPAESIVAAWAAGQRLFGENRVQEWQSKAQSLANLSSAAASPATGLPASLASSASDFILASSSLHDLRMHLIGPLQNNKTTRAAELFHAIDTLDSLKTAERLNHAAQALDKTITVLIEVKLSAEPAKHGVSPADLPALLRAVALLSHLKLSGLMTVPPWSEDAQTARPYFQHLRRLRDENAPQHPTLTELSMGMSNDFEVAIEEGSTTIRLGTAIFGKRIYT